jgi:multiple sugar transport system substrate-binding protein
MSRRTHRLTIGIGSSRLTRRSLLAAGSAALLASHSSFAQEATPAAPLPPFDRDASITSWGFGTEETNPMAFARVNAFKEAYPSIDLTVVPEYDDQKLLTGVASGQVPDLLWIDRTAVATWAARNVLTPLDDFFASAGIATTDFYDAAINQVVWENQHFGLPQFMTIQGLYVNDQAVSEASGDPATLNTGDWDSLSSLGASLVKKNGDSFERWGFDHKMQAGALWTWGQGNGGSFLDGDGNPVLNDPKVVEALDWGVQAYEAQGGFSSYEGFASTWQGDEQFARGQVAISVYESWLLGIIARVAPDLAFRVLPLQPKGGGNPISTTGGNAWAIPQKAGDAEAAQIFIQFMHRDDTWLIGARAVKDAKAQDNQPFIPSLTGKPSADQAQIDQLYETISQPFDDAVKLFPQIMTTSLITPVSSSPVGKQIDDLMKTACQSALRKETSAQDALDKANDDAKQALDDFNA